MMQYDKKITQYENYLQQASLSCPSIRLLVSTQFGISSMEILWKTSCDYPNWFGQGGGGDKKTGDINNE